MTDRDYVRELDSTSAILDLGQTSAFVNTTDLADMKSVLDGINDDDDETSPVEVDTTGKYRGYVPWGQDNQLPYNIIKLIKGDEVLSQNKHFNSLICYGSGLSYKTKLKEEVTNEDIVRFFKYNRPSKYFLDQCFDMKYFLFSVSVIIVDFEGKKINKIIHKEACHCRFETCNPKNGKIEHLYYGDFRDKTPTMEELEIIPVLDYYDPIGDLEVRFGRMPNEKGEKEVPTKERKFAIVNRFPTVDNKYYPFHPSWSIFKSGWYKYKRYVPVAKLSKLENGAKVKYHVEIHRDYWKNLFDEEKITSDEDKKARKLTEYKNIKDFLTGIENSGKVWVSGYYVDPNGKETRMIRIILVDTTKEGGDFIEDSAEASNMMCYADAVHPAMIGATPGKSQGNYSGSVQRELFTIKQALEKPYHDVLLEPYIIIKEFNNWEDIVFDITIITLTTLDKGKDTEENTMREQTNN
jgi:hypothetical protein